MYKPMIKALSILLAVCFLMSVTVAAVSAKVADNAYSSKKLSSEKYFSEKGLSKKNIFIKNLIIRNLIIAKNIFVFKGQSKHPLLHAAVIKKAAMNRDMMEDEEE